MSHLNCLAYFNSADPDLTLLTFASYKCSVDITLKFQDDSYITAVAAGHVHPTYPSRVHRKHLLILMITSLCPHPILTVSSRPFA